MAAEIIDNLYMQFELQSKISVALNTDQAKRLSSYILSCAKVVQSHQFDSPESSLCLPDDSETLKTVQGMVKAFKRPELKVVLVIGIGGSNLGTKAVYDACGGAFDSLEMERTPKLLFADTCDPALITKIGDMLKSLITKPEQLVINLISKSGGTTESIVNAEILIQLLQKKFPEILQRVVVTTDKESKLWNAALALGISVLEIPKKVGGRYSALSAVGLFPLALVNLDVKSLLKGATDMREICLEKNLKKNPAAISALVLHGEYEQGKTIHDTFMFTPSLESLGKWYRQLLGESIGKETDINGNVVHVGITPTVSVGSTDLHSVGQLYLGGPRHSVTTFVWAEKVVKDPIIPKKLLFGGLVDGIQGLRVSQVFQAIRQGTMAAYAKQDLPCMSIALADSSAYELGAFLQFKMMEVMYLGSLFNVNAFDQPNVEAYKTETRRILGSK